MGILNEGSSFTQTDAGNLENPEGTNGLTIRDGDGNIVLETTADNLEVDNGLRVTDGSGNVILETTADNLEARSGLLITDAAGDKILETVDGDLDLTGDVSFLGASGTSLNISDSGTTLLEADAVNDSQVNIDGDLFVSGEVTQGGGGAAVTSLAYDFVTGGI